MHTRTSSAAPGLISIVFAHLLILSAGCGVQSGQVIRDGSDPVSSAGRIARYLARAKETASQVLVKGRIASETGDATVVDLTVVCGASKSIFECAHEPEGTFACVLPRSVLCASSRLFVTATRPDNSCLVGPTRVTLPLPNDIVDLGSVPLKSARTMSCRVVDTDGKAVSGARTFLLWGMTPSYWECLEGDSDDGGLQVFSLLDEPMGEPRLMVHKEGRAVVIDAYLPQVVLLEGGLVRGEVRVPSGASGLDVCVDLLAPGDVQWSKAARERAKLHGVIDARGGFAIEHVPPGPAVVSVLDAISGELLGSARCEVRDGEAVDVGVIDVRQPPVRWCRRKVVCFDLDGRPIAATTALVTRGDVGVALPMVNGAIDFVCPETNKVNVDVAGYCVVKALPTDAKEITLAGGLVARVGLDLSSWLDLPLGTIVHLTFWPNDAGDRVGSSATRNDSVECDCEIGPLAPAHVVFPGAGRYRVSARMTDPVSGREWKLALKTGSILIRGDSEEFLLEMSRS